MSDNSKEELIDLNKMTQRELLIVLNKQMQDVDQRLKEMDKKQEDMSLKINTLETKSKAWGSLAGFVTAIIVMLLEKLFRQ